jgi:hypothetical protein
MPIIRLLAFRGTGGVFDEEHDYYQEAGLIRAGHVALADVIEGKIIGFSPTPEAAEALGGEQALLEALGEHIAQAGRLQDDTAIFERAQALANQGERTQVWELPIEVSEATLDAIKSWYNEKKEYLYNFPDSQGNFPEGEANCATFPKHLSIDVPATTGKLSDYLDAMKLKGAKEWSSQ